MPRLFVAIDPSAPVRDALARLSHGVPGAKWVAPEQFHLTLRFIGAVEGALLDEIAEALGDVEAPAFRLALDGVGHFPPRGAPRVLWAGVNDGAALGRLHERIEARLRQLGVAPDRRRFAPHVTLARLKQAPLARVRDYLALNGAFATEDFPVTAFQLYSSHLGAAGAVHRVEASYPLEGVP